MAGCKDKDTRSLDISFPKDYNPEYLAGKTIKYDFVIHEVYDRIKPKLDDEFASSLGLKDVEGLTSTFEKKLKTEYDKNSRSDLVNQLNGHLLSAIDFPLPEKVLELETKMSKMNMLEDLYRNRAALDKFKEKEDEYDKLIDETAKKRLKIHYIYEEIAKKENISVSNDEVNRLLSLTKTNKKNPEQAESNIRSNLLMAKVSTRLIELSQLEESKS